MSEQICRHCGVRIEAFSNHGGGSNWNHIDPEFPYTRYYYCVANQPWNIETARYAEPKES